jgi:hypothetical protein
MDSRTSDSIFHLIENGMESSDEELGTAVATGLIEGMVGYACGSGSSEGRWDEVRSRLRRLSRSHADEWVKFTDGRI